LGASAPKQFPSQQPRFGSIATEATEVANKATAHLYIYNPLRDYKQGFVTRLFSTHPPIEERVKRLRGM